MEWNRYFCGGYKMLSKHVEDGRNQIEMVALDQLVPEDHLVRKVEQAIDFKFIYVLVKDKYCLVPSRSCRYWKRHLFYCRSLALSNWSIADEISRLVPINTPQVISHNSCFIRMTARSRWKIHLTTPILFINRVSAALALKSISVNLVRKRHH